MTLNEVLIVESIQQDPSSTGRIVRRLIDIATKKAYESGTKPKDDIILNIAKQLANNFHSTLLKAIDAELSRDNPTINTTA